MKENHSKTKVGVTSEFSKRRAFFRSSPPDNCVSCQLGMNKNHWWSLFNDIPVNIPYWTHGGSILGQCWTTIGPTSHGTGKHQTYWPYSDSMLATVTNAAPTPNLNRLNVACPLSSHYQQTRHAHPRLVQCWPSVGDGGPTLNQPWVNVACLLGNNWQRVHHQWKLAYHSEM